MSCVSCPERLQKSVTYVSAAALGVSKRCRNPAWRCKSLSVFFRGSSRLSKHLGVSHAPMKSGPSPNLGSHKPQLPA